MTSDTASPTPSPDSEHAPGFRARRIQNWVFLGLMYGFFYMSRYNFASIAAQIGAVYGWTNTQYGIIQSFGKSIYGLSVFLNGPLADRIGGKRAILIGSAGAAFFNLAFGLCHIFVVTPAQWEGSNVVTPAELAYNMSGSTMIATFAAVWALNHYFQSFGALSIVKINAAWFRVSERGTFAGIFGIMIQSGRSLAFAVCPFIVSVLPWQWAFWIPAALLVLMWFGNKFLVENSPKDAGFPELHTGDETREEAATAATLAFVLRKVFANKVTWTIALASMCIGMVRNGIDDWFPKYMLTVFHVKRAAAASFLPYQIASWGMPIAAVLGGLVAGTSSDRIFGSRRAPVIFFAFLGQAAALVVLSQVLDSAFAACLTLVAVSFFVQSSHSMIGGAASMDFGGRKAVATAAGLFDGAQYLAGAVMGWGMGALLDHYIDKLHPGAEYRVWPLAPLPFAIVGAALIATLWNARPTKRAAH